MTLWKITINISVGYVSKVDQPHSERTPLISKERKKNASNKILSQMSKKLKKNTTAEGIRSLKGVMNCNFY